MLRINVSSLSGKIEKYVEKYYELSARPFLEPLQDDLQWVSEMLKPHVDGCIIKFELQSVPVTDIDADKLPKSKSRWGLGVEQVGPSCLKKRGLEVDRRLSPDGYSNKFLLKNSGKTTDSKRSSKRRVAKVERISMWDYQQKNEMQASITNEIAIAKRASALGIGPAVRDAFVCCNPKTGTCYKVVVSDYIEGKSLREWVRDLSPAPAQLNEVRAMVKAKIDIMHENGIIHNRMSMDNVILHMVRGKIKDVFITDFISSFDTKDKTMWDYNKWIRDDRNVLLHMMSSDYSFTHAEDVLKYVVENLLKNKELVIS